MIGVAFACILVGIALVFFLPWVGVPVAALGLVLFLLFLVGFGRRAATGREPHSH